jgi:hypothetical protein
MTESAAAAAAAAATTPSIPYKIDLQCGKIGLHCTRDHRIYEIIGRKIKYEGYPVCLGFGRTFHPCNCYFVVQFYRLPYNSNMYQPGHFFF